MMPSKRWTLQFLFMSLIGIAAFMAGLLILDPLRLFHEPWIYKNWLQPNMREQAAGMINHWDFDSFILGTSVLENTSAKEASDILEGKFVNISLSGSSYFERSIVMNYALKKRKIRRILYSLDNLEYVGSREGSVRFPVSEWDYLYDADPLNDLKAYMNAKYLKCALMVLGYPGCMGRITDLDRPNAWLAVEAYSVRFGGLQNWFKAKGDEQIRNALQQISSTIAMIEAGQITTFNDQTKEKIKASQDYVDKTLLRFARDYGDTQFICILPPYSRMRSALLVQQNKASFEIFKATLKYLVKKTTEYDNLEVFGWDDQAFVDDIANYKDLSHYHHTINSWMLKAIKSRTGLLTPANIDSYLEQYASKAEHFDFTEFASSLNRNLGK